MESNSPFAKIKSQYIVQTIFDFIMDKNFKYKFINYSKFFQKKFKIDKEFYKEIYLKELDINLNNIFIKYKVHSDKCYNKQKLKNNFENYLSTYKIDLDIFKKYILNFSNYKREFENNVITKDIDIYFPFFDDLSQTNFFDKFFVPINVEVIESNNILNDYIMTFQKLNKCNLKYPGLKFIYKDGKDINYLKELQLNINSIKKLEIENYGAIPSHSNIFSIFNSFVFWQSNYDYFFKTLFSFNGIENNLIELSFYDCESIIPDSFCGIQNLKAL